jgi:hypothetical protein
MACLQYCIRGQTGGRTDDRTRLDNRVSKTETCPLGILKERNFVWKDFFLFTSLHFTSLHFTSLHFTSLQFTPLPFNLFYFNSLYFTLHYRSRDSSVALALGYGLDDRGSRVRFQARAGNFSLHHRIQNGSGAHPASYPMGTRGSFSGCKVAEAWSWPLTSIYCRGQRMSGALTPLSQYAFMAWCSVKHRDTFTMDNIFELFRRKDTQTLLCPNLHPSLVSHGDVWSS